MEIFTNPNKIWVNTHSLADVGSYTVQVKATSLDYPNVILYSDKITVNVLASNYPYFQTSLTVLNIYPGQTLTYKFPSLLNLNSYTNQITLLSGGILQPYISYDSYQQSLSIPIPLSIISSE